jgi:hypothetical protein
LLNLCVLNLRDNRFETIPLEIAPLVNLGVPIGCYYQEEMGFLMDSWLYEGFPQEVSAGGTQAILGYLENPTLWYLRHYSLAVGGFGGLAALGVIGLLWRQKTRRKSKRKNDE